MSILHDLKKQAERFDLERFLRVYDETLIDKLNKADLEKPDFELGNIGIELTKIFPDANGEKGSPSEARKSVLDKILNGLEKSLNESKIPKLHLNIQFSSTIEIKSDEIDEYISRLFNCLSSKSWTENEYRYIHTWDFPTIFPHQLIPNAVETIIVTCSSALSRHRVFIYMSGWVTQMQRKIVSRIIEQKEIKKRAYRNYDKYWLLLYSIPFLIQEYIQWRNVLKTLIAQVSIRFFFLIFFIVLTRNSRFHQYFLAKKHIVIERKRFRFSIVRFSFFLRRLVGNGFE